MIRQTKDAEAGGKEAGRKDALKMEQRKARRASVISGIFSAPIEPMQEIRDGRNILSIPEFDQEHIEEFYKKASAYAGETTEKERFTRFMKFVARKMSFEGKDIWDREGKRVKLEDVIKRCEGLCKEQAAILAIFLEKEGYPVLFCIGRNAYISDNVLTSWISNDELHAWDIVISRKGRVYAISPSTEEIVRINGHMHDKELGVVLDVLRKKPSEVIGISHVEKLKALIDASREK